MPTPPVTLPPTDHDWDALRTELDVPDVFPEEVEREAEASASRPALSGRDLTDVPFWTIDPPGSVDLDQAMSLSRTRNGYLVRYAIADVAAFVKPGGAVDREAHARGLTLYAPDSRTPLYPTVLSEGGASLLPDQDRPALVWELELDSDGQLVEARVERATVRSREQLDYASVQHTLDDGTATEGLLLLKEIGSLRLALARERGAVDLPTPEQEVSADGTLTYRAPRDSERWNAEISLLTGMAAAELMVEHKIGLLRTLPVPEADEVASVRRSALALGIPWPQGAQYGDIVSALDPHDAQAAALLTLATRLLRGAAYTAFDGELPAVATHSAVAAPYAHCTAPLRRLADRYVGEVCLALTAGQSVPDWVRTALPTLPAEMAAADQRARALERAAIDLAETYVLQRRVGERFQGVVVDVNDRGGTIQLLDPAVRSRLEGRAELGERIEVVLERADLASRHVVFRPA